MAAAHAENGSSQSNTNNHGANASHPDSGESSSPQSRGTDCDGSAPTAAWDDVPPPLPPHHSSRHGHNHHHPAQRVKFMCSYGGRIQPRAHDNQLSYVGGDTKIVAVDRSIRFTQLLARLAALLPAGAGDACFKYQLPGEDLDALISVTNDEDIEHMIVEYDRLQRSSSKPSRLRLFLFPVESLASGFISSDSKPSDRQWFVDALNSVPAQPALTNSITPPVPPPESGFCNPDFLFGLEKACGSFPPPVAIHDLISEAKVSAESSPIDDGAPDTTGSSSTKEDNWIGGGEPPVAHQPEIQRQIQGLETLHIASQQETPGAAYYTKQQQQQQRRESTDEENHSSSYPGEYNLQPEVQAVQENAPAARQIPVAYLPERMLPNGSVYSSIAGLDRPLYLIPPPAPQGVYSGTVVQALASQAGQGYYVSTRQGAPNGLHQTIYTVSPLPPPQPSAKTVGAYARQGNVEAGGGINAPAPQLLTAYDSAGRPLYYVRPGPPAGGGGVLPAYQTQRATSAADAARSGAIPQPTTQPQLAAPAAAVATAVTTTQLLNPENNKIATKQPLQASS